MVLSTSRFDVSPVGKHSLPSINAMRIDSFINVRSVRISDWPRSYRVDATVPHSWQTITPNTSWHSTAGTCRLQFMHLTCVGSIVLLRRTESG